MKVDKDIYLKILDYCDDKTALAMLSTCKKFNDTNIFKAILRKRYPLFEYFRNDEDWRNFYIKMVLYLSKLKQEFDFDYILTPSFNPEKLYKSMVSEYIYVLRTKFGFHYVPSPFCNPDKIYKEKIQKKIDDENEYILERFQLCFKCEIETPENIKKDPVFIELTNYDYYNFIEEDLMFHSALGGNLDLLKFFVSKGYNINPIVFKGAIMSKNKKVMEFMEKFKDEFDEFDIEEQFVSGGAEMGDFELIKKTLSNLDDKDYYNQMIFSICMSSIEAGRLEILKKYLNKSPLYFFGKNKEFSYIRYIDEYIGKALKYKNKSILALLIKSLYDSKRKIKYLDKFYVDNKDKEYLKFLFPKIDNLYY